MARVLSPHELENQKREEARIADQDAKQRRKFFVSQCGEAIGNSLFEYLSADIQNRSTARLALATAIVNVLETGTTLDQIRAIEAMFVYFDEKIAPVRALAQDTAHNLDLKNSLYG